MVNLCEGEDNDELLTVDQRVAELEYFEEPFEIILDSGAGEHVASDKDAPGYSVVPSKGSKIGQNFVGAGGHKMRNKGEMALRLKTGSDLSGCRCHASTVECC